MTINELINLFYDPEGVIFDIFNIDDDLIFSGWAVDVPRDLKSTVIDAIDTSSKRQHLTVLIND